MRAPFSTLKALGVIVVLMLIALGNSATAQTASNTENTSTVNVLKHARVITKGFTVVRANGSVIQTVNGGVSGEQKWTSVDAETAAKIKSNLQSTVAPQPMTAEVTLTERMVRANSPSSRNARGNDGLAESEGAH